MAKVKQAGITRSDKPVEKDPEIDAISVVYAVLKLLNSDGQRRVIEYVMSKLGLHIEQPTPSRGRESSTRHAPRTWSRAWPRPSPRRTCSRPGSSSAS